MELPDRRLIDRVVRRSGIDTAQLEERLGELPDLSDRVRQFGDAELEALRAELVAEHAARSQRVARQMSEDRTVRRKTAPVVPIPESEL
jgi:hypothetical protein